MMNWIDYLKALGFDSNQLENLIFKYTENGVPVIDVENGVDKLYKKESLKKEEKPKSDEKVRYNVMNNCEGFEPISKELSDYPDYDVIVKDPETNTPRVDKSTKYSGITMHSGNNFDLNQYVGNKMIGSTTNLVFESYDAQGLPIAGITDKQLVEVLLLRNRKNPDLKETLLDLLDLF